MMSIDRMENPMNRAEDYQERFCIMVEGETDRQKIKQISLLAGQETAEKWWKYCDRCQGWSLNKIRRHDEQREISGIE